MDNINPLITDPIANACIAFQAGEEALHSYSYAFIGDDILGSQRIYEMVMLDTKLKNLANRINSRYDNIFSSNQEVTNEDKAFVAIANLCLEGISFPAGFIVVWALGEKMQGSASMITEISRNELGSHLPLYINIYKHIKEDTGVNIDELARETIIQAGEDEKEFLIYSTTGLLGFHEEAIGVVT